MIELSDNAEAVADRIDSRCAEERGLTLDSLCASCKHGQVMRRRGKLDVMAFCHASFDSMRQVPPDLAECSKYESNSVPSLHDMKKVAVIVDEREGINDKAYL